MNSNHTYSYGLQFQSKGEKRKIKETEHRHLCIARLIQLSSQDRWPGNAIRVTSSSITRSSSRLTFSSARNLLILFEWYIRFYLPLAMVWNVGFFFREELVLLLRSEKRHVERGRWQYLVAGGGRGSWGRVPWRGFDGLTRIFRSFPHVRVACVAVSVWQCAFGAHYRSERRRKK